MLFVRSLQTFLLLSPLLCVFVFKHRSIAAGPSARARAPQSDDLCARVQSAVSFYGRVTHVVVARCRNISSNKDTTSLESIVLRRADLPLRVVRTN